MIVYSQPNILSRFKGEIVINPQVHFECVIGDTISLYKSGLEDDFSHING